MEYYAQPLDIYTQCIILFNIMLMKSILITHVNSLIIILQSAEDYGGPRKEFFRLALLEIKKKYFDQGIREHLCEDYFMVGLIMGKAHSCLQQCVHVIVCVSVLNLTVML